MAKNLSAFTLVELLIVIALLSISVGITSDILVTLVRSYNKTQVANEIEQQANFVTLKLEKEIRGAKNVTVTDSGRTLTFIDSLGATVTYQVTLPPDSLVTRTYGELSPQNLTINTTGGVKVTCSTVCFSENGTSPQIVNVNLSFNQAQATTKKDLTGAYTYQNVFVIRNSY